MGRSRRPFEVAARPMKLLNILRLRLELAALWVAIGMTRALPVQTASWLSGNLWRLIAPFLGRQKRALANLELAFPEKSPGERKAIAAAMWENLGRTFAESLHIKALTKGDRIVFEPAEGFDEAARGAKPFIVCGLHLGNWEILAHGGQRLGVSLIGVYQRLSNPACRSTPAQHARAALQSRFDVQDSHDRARSFARHQGWSLPMLSCRSSGRSRSACALLRKTRAFKRLSRPPRPHNGRTTLRRRCVSPSGRAFQHPYRAHFHAAHERQRCGRARGDANAATPVRGFHPRGAGAMDVGASEVGVTRYRNSAPVARPASFEARWAQIAFMRDAARRARCRFSCVRVTGRD